MHNFETNLSISLGWGSKPAVPPHLQPQGYYINISCQICCKFLFLQIFICLWKVVYICYDPLSHQYVKLDHAVLNSTGHVYETIKHKIWNTEVSNSVGILKLEIQPGLNWYRNLR
jgi:hypothetical protein